MAIKWSKEERAAVAAELVNVYTDNPFLNGYDAIMRAQHVLPKARQRTSMSKTMPSLYIVEIAEAKAEATERRKAAKEAPPPPAPPTDPTLGDLFERMIDMIVRRVVAELRKEQAPVAVPAPTHTNTKERELLMNTPPRPSEIDVLIIGLNGYQLSALEDLESKLNMDFKLLTTDEAATRPYVRRSYTVLMTKFISHKVHDKYRCADNLQYCNGGVTELRAQLNRIAENHK